MARVQVPPTEPKSHDSTLPTNVKIDNGVDATSICREFVAGLGQACEAGDWSFVDKNFRDESFLRDQIALSATLRTFRGKSQVKKALSVLIPRSQAKNFRLVEGSAEVVRPPVEGVAWLQALYTFETGSPAANCSGAFRLLPADNSAGSATWQAWTISSTVESLKGYEPTNPLLKTASANGHVLKGVNGHANGHAQNGTAEDQERYDVAVIGAGQNGTQVAARLRALGISVIVIDRNAAAGDSWKLRYDLLCLHTPKAYGHPAYLPYPEDVPEFVPTARVAEQYRMLAEQAGIKVRSLSEVEKATFDKETNTWTVETKNVQDGTASPKPNIKASFLVFAAGAGSQKASMPDFPGRENYKGEIIHSSAYMNGKRWAGKRAIVIGTANSGHDMAQDLHLTGAKDITIVQREKTFVIPREYLGGVLSAAYNSRYASDVSDRFSFGTPFAVTRALVLRIHHDLIKKNATRFDRLESAGFKVIRDGDLLAHTLGRGGGHYVDIGCSELIANGDIKVKSGTPITGFTSTGLEFADGSTVDADLVLFATGFRDKNLRLQAEEIVGQEISDDLEDVWGLNSEGEVRGTWRPCGHPRFIIMAGDVAISRYYSHVAAIQIQEALLGVGLPPYTD